MFDVDEFIAGCVGASIEADPRGAIVELLGRAVSRPDWVARALPATRGELVSLYLSPELSVLKVIWAPGMAFPPHNHGMWAAIGIYGGQEDNRFYRRGGAGIEAAGERRLGERETISFGDRAIHAVTNPRRSFTAAIHVYGGDISNNVGRSEWDAVTLEEMPYDFARSTRYFEEANARAVAGPMTA